MTTGTDYKVVWPDGDVYANRNGEIRLSAVEARATVQAIGGTWRHARNSGGRPPVLLQAHLRPRDGQAEHEGTRH